MFGAGNIVQFVAEEAVAGKQVGVEVEEQHNSCDEQRETCMLMP
jgi:hypothetical protein